MLERSTAGIANNIFLILFVCLDKQLPRKTSSRVLNRAKEQAAIASTKHNQSYALVSDDDQDITVTPTSPIKVMYERVAFRSNLVLLGTLSK